MVTLRCVTVLVVFLSKCDFETELLWWHGSRPRDCEGGIEWIQKRSRSDLKKNYERKIVEHYHKCLHTAVVECAGKLTWRLLSAWFAAFRDCAERRGAPVSRATRGLLPSFLLGFTNSQRTLRAPKDTWGTCVGIVVPAALTRSAPVGAEHASHAPPRMPLWWSVLLSDLTLIAFQQRLQNPRRLWLLQSIGNLFKMNCQLDFK